MKAAKNDGLSLHHKLENFLFTYRTTPHATTHQSPTALFLGRNVRTRLDLLKPNLQGSVAAKQAEQKRQHDQHAHSRSIQAGQPVMVKNMRPGDAWIPGVVLKQLGPVSYLVDVGGGRVWKRHLDHLKIRDLPEPEAGENVTNNNNDIPEVPVPTQDMPEELPGTTTTPTETPRPVEPVRNRTVDESTTTSGSSSTTTEDPSLPLPTSRRYPVRERHPPDRFTY